MKKAETGRIQQVQERKLRKSRASFRKGLTSVSLAVGLVLSVIAIVIMFTTGNADRPGSRISVSLPCFCSDRERRIPGNPVASEDEKVLEKRGRIRFPRDRSLLLTSNTGRLRTHCRPAALRT